MKRWIARARAASVTALLLLSLFSWMATPAAAASLTILAPGWSILDPKSPDGTTVGWARSGHDATGDGLDDLVLSYNPTYGYKPEPPFFFSNASFELYAGTVDGVHGPALSSSAMSTASPFGFDASVTFPRNLTDFNGDGLADAVFGGYDYTDYNASKEVLEFFHGSAGGFPAKPNCTVTLVGDASSSTSWAWLPGGDFDGDGRSDLLVLESSYPASPAPPGRDPNGTVDPSSPTMQLKLVSGGCEGPSVVDGPFVEGAHNGYPALLGRGDFNRDGYEDAVLDEVVYGSGSNTQHYLTVLPGSRLGPTNATAQLLSLQTSPSTRFAVGADLDRDGYGDLVLMLGYQAGFAGEFFDVLVYRGTPSGLSLTPTVAQTVGGEGFSVATPGFCDVDGDGSVDLALMHSNTSNGETNVTIDVFFGDRGAFAGLRDWTSTVMVSRANDSFFWGVGTGLDVAGDFDGDGLSDIALLVSAPFYGPLDRAPTTTEADSAVLFYYGKDIVRDVSAVVPVGFDAGVGYPTYLHGFDLKQKASNVSAFDRFAMETAVGTLNYDAANGTFSWEPNASYSGADILALSNESKAWWDDTTRTWQIQFRFVFAWSFPTEDHVGYSFVSSKDAIPGIAGRGATGSFRVEKDLAFVGELSAENATTSVPLPPGGWVAAGAGLRLRGLGVVFEGAPDRPVPPEFFNWSIQDDDGTAWMASGSKLAAAVEADLASDPDENATVGLTGLPDPGVGAPTRAFPFRVDADAPEFAVALPTNEAWLSNKTVAIAIVVRDLLSGVDSNSIEYQVSTGGSGSFGPWLSPSVDDSDPQAVRARATALFENGDQNFFRFRAKDLVGNGYVTSPDFQVRVDTLHVIFLNPAPAPDVWQRNPAVSVSVLVRDLGASGVNGSSLAYRLATDDIFAYGPWVPVPAVVSSTEISLALSLLFAEGDANYVQWRAQDLVGTGLTVSDHYRNQVDGTPIVFGRVTPDPQPRQTGEKLTVSINASDGRPATVHQSGLDPAAVQFRYRPSGGNFSNWTHEGVTAVPVDAANWSLRVVLSLAPGPGNEVEFRGADAAGNGPTSSAVFAFHLNRAPSAAIELNALDGTLYADTPLNLSGILVDPDGDNLTFEWRNQAGDVLSNTSLNLSVFLLPGHYTFDLGARDPFGARAHATVSVEVTERPPPPPPPPAPPPVVTAGSDLAPFFAILLVALGGAAAVGLWLRRRREEPPAG